jgi:Family of unknown function (DUF6788)
MRSRLQQLSQLRSSLREALRDLERTLHCVFQRGPLLKGNVCELARRCGKPSCACTRGKLHRTMVLSWSEQGKTRLIAIPPERLEDVRKRSERYLQFRRARAEATKIHRRILKLLDRIEKLRREEF